MPNYELTFVYSNHLLTNTKNTFKYLPPSKRPEGASCSQRRAAFGTSSTTAKARTGAKLGPGAKANTKGAEAKTGAKKAAALEAAHTNPCSQSLAAKQEKEGDAKRDAASSGSAREWPSFKIDDPAKVKYAERRCAAYLQKKVELQPPTNEELTKELQESIDCARAVLPNFKLEAPVVAGDPEGKIRRAQWKWVQAALTSVTSGSATKQSRSTPAMCGCQMVSRADKEDSV